MQPEELGCGRAVLSATLENRLQQRGLDKLKKTLIELRIVTLVFAECHLGRPLRKVPLNPFGRRSRR